MYFLDSPLTPSLNSVVDTIPDSSFNSSVLSEVDLNYDLNELVDINSENFQGRNQDILSIQSATKPEHDTISKTDDIEKVLSSTTSNQNSHYESTISKCHFLHRLYFILEAKLSLLIIIIKL